MSQDQKEKMMSDSIKMMSQIWSDLVPLHLKDQVLYLIGFSPQYQEQQNLERDLDALQDLSLEQVSQKTNRCIVLFREAVRSCTVALMSQKTEKHAERFIVGQKKENPS